MSNELRTLEQVEAWLGTGLVLRRVEYDLDHPLVTQVIAQCASDLSTMPPPAVIVDIIALLNGGRQTMTPPHTNNDALKTSIGMYGDDLVARFVQSPLYDDILSAYSHASVGDKALAVSLVVAAICERSKFKGVQISPGTLRRAASKTKEELETIGRDIVNTNSMLVADFAEAYQSLARGARQCRSLIDQRDIFSIDNLTVLRNLGGRMTADHINAAAEAIGKCFPRRLPANKSRRGSHDSHFEEDNLYPAGGFSSIAPGGMNANIENLVSSELAYMEDGDGIDSFTVRYLEGELLFFTRDESVFRRQRHVIGIALNPDLDDARVKDRDLPWQRLVLTFGMLVAAIRWLVDQLNDQALLIRVAFPEKLLKQEREIVSLLLQGEILRGVVEIKEESTDKIVELVTKASSSAIGDTVIVSLNDKPVVSNKLRCLHINLANQSPKVAEISPRQVAYSDDDLDVWDNWCESAKDIIKWLV